MPAMSPPSPRRSLYFVAPGEVEVRREPCPLPAPDEVLVATQVSAISAGTELLFYRGQVPADLRADATIAALAGPSAYPLKYGYACVGRVTTLGATVDPAWHGRTVFAFQPHESHFTARPAQLIPVPPDVAPEHAALLPNMETAVNFLMDGAPLIGERVLVLGLGIVGQLTCALLARFPLAELVAVDAVPARRARAAALGVRTLSPAELSQQPPLGADLVYEVSGNPAALDSAIAHARFDGRVVIGSWYGDKRAPVELGGVFHRSRIRLISSQVSTIAPGHTGRWDKARRLDVAWSMLRAVDVDPLITHRLPLDDAAAAYAQLDRDPAHTLQILLTHTAAA